MRGQGRPAHRGLVATRGDSRKRSLRLRAPGAAVDAWQEERARHDHRRLVIYHVSQLSEAPVSTGTSARRRNNCVYLLPLLSFRKYSSTCFAKPSGTRSPLGLRTVPPAVVVSTFLRSSISICSTP